MKKTFRINVVISYFERVNVNQYRQPILNILTNLAWLYRLEYAISINHNFGIEDGGADLIYIRSTKETRISKKELNILITTLFRNGLSYLYEGVEVSCQMYKALPQYPFPSAYYKPLNYPYVETHSENESILCICKEALQEIIDDVENTQDSNLLPS